MGTVPLFADEKGTVPIQSPFLPSGLPAFRRSGGRKMKTVFTGHFGSGKSEIAVNLALKESGAGTPAHFIDLDIVKPYIRSRMVRNLLLSTGVHMIIPSGEHVYADLPIVMPQIKTILQDPQARVFLDVAGDADGCRVLSSFHEILLAADPELMLVVNASRPRTDDVAGNLKMLDEIQAGARLKVTAIVANTHLMDETTPAVVEDGFAVAAEFAKQAGLTVKWVVAKKDIAGALVAARFPCPILEIETYIRPPFGYHPQGLRRSSIIV